MPEQMIQDRATRFVFRPQNEEKTDLITNNYLMRMPRDENLRYELIGGEIFASTAPRFIHQLLATRIVVEFGDYLKTNPLGRILTTPGLIFSDFDGVIPDLIYISHERTEEILDEKTGKFRGAPEIVIEILSPGRANARRDLQIKRELYEIYEVSEYWVVDPFEKELTIFKRKGTELEKIRTYKENENLITEFLPEFDLDVRKLFAN